MAYLPGVLVLGSLAWLAILAIALPRTIGFLLREISQTIDPAERAATDLQLALSMEAASTRAFLLTGSPRYAEEFEAARSSRRIALDSLANFSSAGPVGMAVTVAALTSDLDAADELLDGLYAGTLTRQAYLGQLPLQHRRFRNLTAGVADLHHAVTTHASGRRDRIFANISRGGLLALAGVLLGIAASFSVAWLQLNQRAFARREHASRLALERMHAAAVARGQQIERMTDRWTRLIRGFSHDLKNPLGAADGYLFMLETGTMSALTPKQQHAISKSRHSLQTAIALTHDLVELARAEAAELDVRRTAMDLCDAVTNVVEDYRAQASSKGLIINMDLPSPAATVLSDPARVGQILGNLVNNAIKYTPAGEVTIRVGHRQAQDGTRAAVVDVLDTGPGIPREHQQRIFQEFERLDAAGSSGAGIGLAISQRLAKLLGGGVTVESETGQGSTFTLWLPLDQAG